MSDDYYCESCGALFPSDEVRIVSYQERHFWLDDAPAERMVEYLCPECGSACIREAEYCEICGLPFRPGDLDDSICAECRRKEKME